MKSIALGNLRVPPNYELWRSGGLFHSETMMCLMRQANDRVRQLRCSDALDLWKWEKMDQPDQADTQALARTHKRGRLVARIRSARINIELAQATIECGPTDSQPLGRLGPIAFCISQSSKQFGFLVLA